MATTRLIGWFRSRSRHVRYFLVGFFVPLIWSILFGVPGLILGATNVHSIGAVLVAVALFIHLPSLIVLGQLGLLPFSPGGDDSGGIEIIMLGIVTLPSCLFYACVGWLLAKAMEAKDAA